MNAWLLQHTSSALTNHLDLSSLSPLEGRTFLLAAMAFSGAAAVFISYTTAWCVRTTSSTTYSMVGALNKLPVAASGMMFFGDPVSLGNVSAISTGFVAGLVYAVAKIHQGKQANNAPLSTKGYKAWTSFLFLSTLSRLFFFFFFEDRCVYRCLYLSLWTVTVPYVFSSLRTHQHYKQDCQQPWCLITITHPRDTLEPLSYGFIFDSQTCLQGGKSLHQLFFLYNFSLHRHFQSFFSISSSCLSAMMNIYLYLVNIDSRFVYRSLHI